MAEFTTTKLDAESHLLLDQPLLRMPYNLSRQTFKNAQRAVEHTTAGIMRDLSAAQKCATKADPSKTLDDMDGMISRMKTLKRKLSGLHDEEQKWNRASRARIQHLQTLYEFQSLVDVKYEEWSRTRLARLLVDYLLRSGYSESALALAKSKDIEDLVDVDAFVAALKIEKSLAGERSTAQAMSWCLQNQQALKKMGGKLEFELRLQQYIELLREGHTTMSEMEVEEAWGLDGPAVGVEKLAEARAYAKKHLVQTGGTGDLELLSRAAGLLAYRPWDPVEPYASLYSMDRWKYLAQLFISTHHTLYSLPSRPLLHIALSAGLSALKTPACHSAYASPSANSTSVCPICSTELNELAKNVPYAHHTKSIVDNDPVLLPTGNVYGREKLQAFNNKVGTEAGWVRDPIDGLTGPRYKESEVRKVFFS